MPIPLLPGITSSKAYAVNDLGQVAGMADLSQAFIATTAGSTFIPLPLGATYAGLSMGASTTAGWSSDTATSEDGFGMRPTEQSS